MKNIFYLLLFFALFASCKAMRQPGSGAKGQKAAGATHEQRLQTLPGDKAVASTPGISISYTASNSYLNALDLGFKTDGSDNANTWDKFFNSLPVNYTARLYFPTGTYYFSRQIRVTRPLHIFGDSQSPFTEYGTKFRFKPGTNGLSIDRANNTRADECSIEKIALVSSKTADKTFACGLIIQSVCAIRDVSVRGFNRDGVWAWANMEEGKNASGSLLERVHCLENGNDGFALGRTDGNVILVINCDARDNGRFGFNDDSFLGNNFISCMAHYNKGGDFFVRDWGNAQSLFMGCYSESGSVPSKLGPKSTVVGGVWGSPYTLGSDATLRGGMSYGYLKK